LPSFAAGAIVFGQRFKAVAAAPPALPAALPLPRDLSIIDASLQRGLKTASRVDDGFVD